ncbi:MoaA/NifB/PqqE/SkfB family radical SAM enzyme [Micromonospora pisi]|uniref:MoaA/NifB/PqqE/SkfB family radical SAM enzyme n=1 Tax=Micromonospora pisi TaxID=589240 RepID=A0A495JGW3_9ACTN|nr:radical SAM protein [Micromonospora pisi]RKR87279.1 MoaA/NifB/PqqE/SkfB family radical SAM enzyme [Micromonospora pisi]
MSHDEPAIGACWACGPHAADTSGCRGSLARAGVIRVNWDCWDLCNLDCPFCFRSRAGALGTSDAVRLLDCLSYAGIRHMTFTGGDPSLRSDLGQLVQHAQRLGMAVEVLTNAQHQPPTVRDALLLADLVGLSIDGASPDTHDGFRQRRGNFGRVFKLMDFLDSAGQPYVVRTVVSRANGAEAVALAPLLATRTALVRWSLQQFSAIEAGFDNRDQYELSTVDFFRICAEVRAELGPLDTKLSVLTDRGKVGLYLLVDPQGRALSRLEDPPDGRLPTVGDFLSDHLVDVSSRILFDAPRHAARYEGWMDLHGTDNN